MTQHAILMVDDETNVLKSFERGLRKEAFITLTAENGVEGLKLLSAREVSIVVSDYNMPEMNGLIFLKQVKAQYPHILTIMLTGHSEIDIAVKAINEAGVYKFIQKPWDDEDLRITLKRALESIDLAMERDHLRERIKNRDTILGDLEKKFPGITKIERDEDGSLIIDSY